MLAVIWSSVDGFAIRYILPDSNGGQSIRLFQSLLLAVMQKRDVIHKSKVPVLWMVMFFA